MIYHAISDSCESDRLDPYEVQLALAISESLKDQNPPTSTVETKEGIVCLENPFTSTGKVQMIHSVLEKYGFKSKKIYSDYEIDLIMNNKGKRSKFQKFPTALTHTTSSQRDEMIRMRIDNVMESRIFSEFGTENSGKTVPYVVKRESLVEMHENRDTATTFTKSAAETMSIDDFYVRELFEPTKVTTGFLLKDWNTIIGRETSQSPKKNSIQLTEEPDISVEEWQPENNLCSEEVDTMESDNVVNMLETDFGKNEKEPEKDLSVKSSCAINQEEVTGKNLEHQESKEQESVPSLNSSCSDIFDGLESFTVDDMENSNDLKDVNGHLDRLHEKLSQSKLSHSIKLTENVNSVNIDLTQEGTSESDATQEYMYQGDLSCHNSEEIECFDLTQSNSPIINKPQTDNEIPCHTENVFDLTQRRSSGCSDNESNAHMRQVSEKPMEVDEENENSNKAGDDICDLTQQHSSNESDNESSHSESQQLNEEAMDVDEVLDLTQCDELVSHKSLFGGNEVISISDEEVNYSINYCQNEDSKSSEGNAMSQISGDVLEIDNLAEQSLLDIAANDYGFKIDQNVTDLLIDFSVNRRSSIYVKKDRSMMFFENENINDDSIANIMKKYGVATSPPVAKKKSFTKMQSESNLNMFSNEQDLDLSEIGIYHAVKLPEGVNAAEFSDIEVNNDDNVDLTIINDFSSQHDSPEQQSQELNMSINKSLANILNSPMVRQTQPVTRKSKQRRSLGIIMNEKYEIDTESVFTEPDFASMTPHELKQELFKYGIRPLPVKKAVELLIHIYNQTHPKIKIAADEEIDMHDSRIVMNTTDVATDIGMKGDIDEFAFQLDSNGILEDEEYILPKLKKSKVSI